jgi:hypothetical protein
MSNSLLLLGLLSMGGDSCGESELGRITPVTVRLRQARYVNTILLCAQQMTGVVESLAVPDGKHCQAGAKPRYTHDINHACRETLHETHIQ